MFIFNIPNEIFCFGNTPPPAIELFVHHGEHEWKKNKKNKQPGHEICLSWATDMSSPENTRYEMYRHKDYVLSFADLILTGSESLTSISGPHALAWCLSSEPACTQELPLWQYCASCSMSQNSNKKGNSVLVSYALTQPLIHFTYPIRNPLPKQVASWVSLRALVSRHSHPIVVSAEQSLSAPKAYAEGRAWGVTVEEIWYDKKINK